MFTFKKLKMKEQVLIPHDSQVVLTDLCNNEITEINGGFWIVAAGVVGAVAGLAYLYEFGYNMVDKSLARKQQ